MKNMKKTLLAFLGVGLALIWAGTAQANFVDTPSLFDLVEGQGSIVAGDKLFDQFQIAPNNSIVDITNIFVTPLHDGGINPGPGLEFDVLNDALTVSGGDNSLHLMFGFRVTTLSNQLIKDNSLQFGGGNILRNVTENLGMSINENIFDAAGNLLGEKSVEFSWTEGGGLVANLYDSAYFPPIDEIFVTKDILVWATDPDETAILTNFNQRFSQTPEPTTMLLLGTGLVGVAGAARRKKKNQA